SGSHENCHSWVTSRWWGWEKPDLRLPMTNCFGFTPWVFGDSLQKPSTPWQRGRGACWSSIFNVVGLPPWFGPMGAHSFSDWKNAYTAECETCDEKPRCSGFFTTGRPRYSRGIRRIVNAVRH